MTFPNQLTLLRIILTPIIVYVLTIDTFYYRFAALVLFLVASLTDWYDGYIARRFGSVSNWGKFLDPLADKILVLSVFVAFFVIGEVALWMVVVIAIRDIIITLLRIYALQNKKPIVTSTYAKWKTASQMSAIYLILIFLMLKHKPSLLFDSPHWLNRIESFGIIDKMMYVVTFITATTGLHYLFENRNHVKGFAVSFFRLFLPNL
ncbi:MAG: CDP-diacylglycerol--glycerol-3-phosphate 3-phosphatidyltransferase [bacterium]